MNYAPETPFDNIESAQEYVDLLLEAIEEARREVDSDIAAAKNHADRKRQALQLVALNLNKLSSQIKKSRRILNDLRILRRLLLEERKAPAAEESEPRAVGAA